MLHLLALLLAATAQVSPGSGLPAGTITGGDPRQGPMPVTDKMLLPGRVPDCADAYQAQRAEEEQIKGYTPECLRPANAWRKPRGNSSGN
jgi:hypothetical protein